MPSILYVMKYPLHRCDNLQAKFDGQMESARALGWDAYCIGWDTHGMYLVGENKRVSLHRNAMAGIRGYDHTKIFPDLMKAANEAIRRVPVDVLYLRYMPTFPGALKTMKHLKRNGGKLAVEYPTYPAVQETDRFFMRRQVFRYAGRVMTKINPMVDLYVMIGEDCNGEFNGRPAINIVNGVNVENLPLHAPRTDARDIRLLALASMSGWHGYDRIIKSLAAYHGSADVRIAFVGGDGDGSLAKWKLLTNELGLQKRITFHGPCYGDELEAIIAQSDLGVGSLGLFRFGLRQGITLKTREFIARGLPFVNAVFDPALPEEIRCFLQVPDSEMPIDMAEIVSFAKRVKADLPLPGAMRAYAEHNLGWRSETAKILERLKP